MPRSGGRSDFGSALLGAAFLMATSAIGPGFITQTTVFTEKLRTSFGFVILCSIIIDIIVQLNIWRIVSVSGMPAQNLANQFLKGSGYLLSFLVVLGGLAFNIGNIAGAALGIQVMTGAEIWIGVVISTVISIIIFWYKEIGKAMDRFAKLLGILMIALATYIAISSNPPLVQTIQHSFLPEIVDTSAIIVLVGGTVGGYISFAGAHRLLDAGISGEKNIRAVSNASVKAILLASVMRIVLFLASLGIVMSGGILDKLNPPASVFRLAAGEVGYRIFGLVLWCAAVTSVVGSAFTSVSFVKSFHPFFNKHYRSLITGFILFSAVVFLLVGRPVNVLIVVGALNAFILPIALAILLLAAGKRKLMGTYHHPTWMTVLGWAAAVAIAVMSIKTVATDLAGFWN